MANTQMTTRESVKMRLRNLGGSVGMGVAELARSALEEIEALEVEVASRARVEREIDSARWRKLCGLMAFGECIISRDGDEDIAKGPQPFDYSDELEKWVDAASQERADAGHRDELGHGRGIGVVPSSASNGRVIGVDMGAPDGDRTAEFEAASLTSRVEGYDCIRTDCQRAPGMDCPSCLQRWSKPEYKRLADEEPVVPLPSKAIDEVGTFTREDWDRLGKTVVPRFTLADAASSFGDAIWREFEDTREHRLAMRAVRLLRLTQLNAPEDIIKRERELLRKSFTEFELDDAPKMSRQPCCRCGEPYSLHRPSDTACPEFGSNFFAGGASEPKVLCPEAEKMGEFACKDRSQCWEPCGELGNDDRYVRRAPAGTSEAVDRSLGITRKSKP